MDENYKEILSIRYGGEEIAIEIDLPFKETILVKAFGLEIHSKESLLGLEIVSKRLLENIRNFKNLHFVK